MFSEMDKKVLQVILVVGVVAVLGLFYHVWAKVNPEVKRRDAAIRANTAEIKRKKEELDDLKAWRARAAEIGVIVQSLEEKIARLPRTRSAREFFRILRECVRMTNLTDLKVQRLKEIPMGAYEEVPYLIVCRARYHDLGQFLALIEQHRSQIMRLKTLDISNDIKRPSRHPVTLRVATFVFTQPLPRTKEVASK